MVAVIGSPAQSKLGKVARTDYDTALLVCNVHEDLCTLSCLRILISNIVDIHIVSDVLEVLCNAVRDGYLS